MQRHEMIDRVGEKFLTTNVENDEYSLIFDMITVNRGRVFLKKYNLMKQKTEKSLNF